MDQSNLYTNDEKKEEILSDDPPINGQNWVCLSFVSPTSVIQDKHGFIVAKFLQSIAASEGKEYDKFYEDYTNFKYKYSDKLDKDFASTNNNMTNVQGIKVRGVYATNEEAKQRASFLHRTDPSFHVFMGTVGQWLPWDPDADKIENEVYLDDSLNTLVSEYKRQSNDRDTVFSERISDTRKSNVSEAPYDLPVQINDTNFNVINDQNDQNDPWIQSKLEDSVSEPDTSVVDSIVNDTNVTDVETVQDINDPEPETKPESEPEPEPVSE